MKLLILKCFYFGKFFWFPLNLHDCLKMKKRLIKNKNLSESKKKWKDQKSSQNS